MDWYSVRCIFRFLDAYEERVTIWQAVSHEAAIAMAENEASEYCEVDPRIDYCGLAQAYQMIGAPDPGTEVFSLMRVSDLGVADYLDRFFSAGTERQDNL